MRKKRNNELLILRLIVNDLKWKLEYIFWSCWFPGSCTTLELRKFLNYLLNGFQLVTYECNTNSKQSDGRLKTNSPEKVCCPKREKASCRDSATWKGQGAYTHSFARWCFQY